MTAPIPLTQASSQTGIPEARIRHEIKPRLTRDGEYISAISLRVLVRRFKAAGELLSSPNRS